MTKFRDIMFIKNLRALNIQELEGWNLGIHRNYVTSFLDVENRRNFLSTISSSSRRFCCDFPPPSSIDQLQYGNGNSSSFTTHTHSHLHTHSQLDTRFDIWCQFHQLSTSSFCARKSLKSKKTLTFDWILMLLGATRVKAAGKFVDPWCMVSISPTFY